TVHPRIQALHSRSTPRAPERRSSSPSYPSSSLPPAAPPPSPLPPRPLPRPPPTPARSPPPPPPRPPAPRPRAVPRRGHRGPAFRFWSWDGPADGPTITGKRAWTAIAEGAASDKDRRVLISVEDFVKTDGKTNTFTAPFGDVVSPVALAQIVAPPASLSAGDA